jgi:hypothetical protein
MPYTYEERFHIFEADRAVSELCKGKTVLGVVCGWAGALSLMKLQGARVYVYGIYPFHVVEAGITPWAGEKVDVVVSDGSIIDDEETKEKLRGAGITSVIVVSVSVTSTTKPYLKDVKEFSDGSYFGVYELGGATRTDEVSYTGENE